MKKKYGMQTAITSGDDGDVLKPWVKAPDIDAWLNKQKDKLAEQRKVRRRVYLKAFRETEEHICFTCKKELTKDEEGGEAIETAHGVRLYDAIHARMRRRELGMAP